MAVTNSLQLYSWLVASLAVAMYTTVYPLDVHTANYLVKAGLQGSVFVTGPSKTSLIYMKYLT